MTDLPKEDKLTQEHKEQEEKLPTALGVSLLRCSNCQDMVVPEHYGTLKEMENEECAQCNSGKLKPVEADMMRVKDVEQFFEIENLINQLAIAHRHIDQNKIAGKAKETNERLQEKLEEVQNQ